MHRHRCRITPCPDAYDVFDRLLITTERGVSISYGYDANGNRTLVLSPSGTTTYTFDSRNRLQTANDGSSTTGFTYYPDGKKNTVVYPNGTDVKYTYYDTNRIQTVLNEATQGGTVISSYAYGYDANGNRTSQTEVQNGTTETTAYTYDGLDRLASFLVTDGTGTTTNTEYAFEGYNRKTEKVTTNGTVSADKTYTSDETDWLTRVEDSVSGDVVNYAYDRNGNTMVRTDSLSPDRNLNFAYDSRNQLVQTTGANNAVLGQYDYNSQGLRIRHRHSDRGDVDYYYDGRSVIDEYDAASGSPLAHYRYADRLLSLSSMDGVQYYHHDGLGSTVNLTDTAGATKVSYRLDPWGHIRSQSGFTINRHVFTGKEYDQNTGLTYFGARYYDADTARFITQDTYLGEQNTPPSLHRYLYAYGNPTVYVDLFGYASLSTEYMRKVDENLAEGNVWTAGAWFVGRQIHNALSFGFLDAHDPWYDKFERGEIDKTEYALRTTAALSRSVAVGTVMYVTAGAAGAGTAGLTAELGAGTVTTALTSGTVAGATAGVSGLLTSDVIDASTGGGFHSAKDYLKTAGIGAFAGFATAGIVEGANSQFAPDILKASYARTDNQYAATAKQFETARGAGRNVGEYIKARAMKESMANAWGRTNGALAKYDPEFAARQMQGWGMTAYDARIAALVQAQEIPMLGKPGGNAWLLPASEMFKATSMSDIALNTGLASSVAKAAELGESVFATAVPLKNTTLTAATANDVGVNINYTGKGFTGIRGDDFWIYNPHIQEMLAPYQPMPTGSMQLRFIPGRGWVPTRGL